jgi:hypothetical protein
MMRRTLLALLWLALALPQSPALADSARHLAIVLDTSTSMRERVNDRPRLAIQAIKILTDLLGPDDALTLTWMPDSPSCTQAPDPARRLDFRAGDLAGFKQALDARATYGGPTNFIVPLQAARDALETVRARERLLIVVSDAGRDTCQGASNQILRALRAAGVRTALVSLGEQGKPVHNEYDIRTSAQDPTELLRAIGEIYQRFLGAKAPDSGTLSPASAGISAEVAPFVGEAFLLVAADGPVGAIAPEPGNPAAEGIDPDYRAGETRGLDDLTRGYRILRLRGPQPGTWRLAVGGLTGRAGWYLIQDFSVGLRASTPPAVAQGQEVLVTLEPIDERTGQRIARPEQIPGLAATALIEGTTYGFRDDGQGGDATANDGLMTARVRFNRLGPATFPVRLASRDIQLEQQQRTEVGPVVEHSLAFGTPGVLDLGRLASGSERETRLDLGFVAAKGRFDLRLKSGFSPARSVLEIDLGQGFETLPASGLDLSVQDSSNRLYPIRLRIGQCPEGVLPDQAGGLVLEATDQLGQRLRAAIPIRVEIVADPWLHCWWPVIAAILLAVLTVFVLYGILSPARFPRNLSVVLSPEADMDEGYPFNIRSQRGARSGFYRDARMHIAADFQLRRSASGALARLRADRLGVFILALPGNTVMQLDEDNKWEPLGTGRETRVRFSTPYKNAAGSLYFEFRNR